MKIKLFFCALFCATSVLAQVPKLEFPLGGNAFSSARDSKTVSNKGLVQWSDPKEHFKMYVRTTAFGKLSIGTGDFIAKEDASLSFEINGVAKTIDFVSGKPSSKIISWELTDTGYTTILLKGIKKQGEYFPALEKLYLEGKALTGNTAFVRNNEGNFFYWGRRGPSTHLSYTMPTNMDVTYFYNELTVPKDEDIIGSYYMANGFAEGYFGIQVNSETERRILFSVWSPFNTDDPKSIPEDQKIKMLKKGKDVYTGEFGNEGSGGQSYLKLPWKAGNTYKFLLKGVPEADSTTTYSAWFYAPEEGDWRLIASFKRPKTKTYLKRFHSFLENFIPQTGDISRKVLFNNQWVGDASGNWKELTDARFTIDNTGNVKYRLDYAGGEEKGGFFLMNCGFFDNFTPARSTFSRPAGNKQPNIDFKKLENLGQ